MTEHQSSEEGAEGLRLTEAEREALVKMIRGMAGTTSAFQVGRIAPTVEGILADRLAAVRADRDHWIEQADDRLVERVEALDRAESAEAEITRLRAQVAEVEAPCLHRPPEPPATCWCRAALASPTSHAQREAEVGARVLREAAADAEGQCWCQVDLNPASAESCEGITDEAAAWLRARADALAAEAGGE